MTANMTLRSIKRTPEGWGADSYTQRPRLLDLYCGAGGAAVGYYRAGFDVIGVDINPQPHYPYRFIQADALTFLGRNSGRFRGWFDAIHASPPCQRFTRFQQSQPKRENTHRDLITPTRPLLEAAGVPWIMENVPGSPLRKPVTLCGTAFGLGVDRGQLWRHRWFEASFPITGTVCAHDGRPAVMVAGHGKDGYRGSGLNAAEAREAMRIDWMNRDELAEAIPPKYTEEIGGQLIEWMDRPMRGEGLVLSEGQAEELAKHLASARPPTGEERIRRQRELYENAGKVFVSKGSSKSDTSVAGGSV